MNLGQMRAYVRKQTLVGSDAVDAATMNQFINEGMHALAVRFPWPFLEVQNTITSVADQAAYALPADFRVTRGVVPQETGRRLSRITFDEASARWGGDMPTASRATAFYTYGGVLYLVPTPDISGVIYDHFYTKALPPLTADNQEPEFLSEFHIVPARFAIARVWEYEEDYPKVREADSRFDMDVELMARFYFKRAEEKPMIYGESRRHTIIDNMPFLSGV